LFSVLFVFGAVGVWVDGCEGGWVGVRLGGGVGGRECGWQGVGRGLVWKGLMLLPAAPAC